MSRDECNAKAGFMTRAQNFVLQMATVTPVHYSNSARPSGCTVLLRSHLYRVVILVGDNFKYFLYD